MQVSSVADFGSGITTSSTTFNLSATTITLSANTSYYFRLSAYNRGGGQSNYNASIATVTLARSPSFSGFDMFNTSITVNLLANENSDGTDYRLQVSTDGFSTIAFSSQGAALTLTAFGLQTNSTYQIGIDALNFNGIASS